MLKDLHRRLRPMGILDILDETAELYRRNFVLLIGISAFLYVPLFILQASMQMPSITDPREITREGITRFVVLLAAALVVYQFAVAIVTGALTLAISDRYLERETSIRACYTRMLKFRLFWSFIGANLLSGLIVLAPLVPGVGTLLAGIILGKGGGEVFLVLGVLLLLAGGIASVFIALRMTLVAPSFFVETGAAWPAIKRSWQLMEGNAGKALGLLFITSAFVSLIQQLVLMPFQILGVRAIMSGATDAMRTSPVEMLLSTVMSTLLMPLTSIVLILLYYDIRIRKEGFDLELLARDLDERTREFAAGGAAALPQEQITSPYLSQEQVPPPSPPQEQIPPAPPQEQVAPPPPEPPPSTEGQA